jgi:hypothetical protein
LSCFRGIESELGPIGGAQERDKPAGLVGPEDRSELAHLGELLRRLRRPREAEPRD